MGAASSLFWSSDAEKQTLSRRITPSDEQFEEQQERWNDLAEFLITDLAERSGYAISTWLQGSYKFGTQIRPPHRGEFDIDLGVYYKWPGLPADGKHSARTLKAFVQDSLTSYAAKNPDDVQEVCEPKTRCCRLRYKNGFHIDVPAYHLDAERDARTLATEDGWEDSDPKAIYIWFRDLFDDLDRAKVRRQIRYFKAWAALKFLEEAGRPSSVVLTVLVAEAVTAIINDSELGSDDDAVPAILDKIIRRLEAKCEVANPVDREEDLLRMSDEEKATFLQRLRVFWDVARRAAEAQETLKAADIWQEAFEHLLPMPEVPKDVAEGSRLLPVPITLPEVAVSAVSRKNPTGRFTGMNKIGPIPKDCDIAFQITNHQEFSPESKVFWMVRNEGREAENVNDMGHRAGTGLTAEEHSAYKGTHYMDCLVKIHGATIAWRRIPVTIAGLEMPLRNPKRRPSWTKLRGRR